MCVSVATFTIRSIVVATKAVLILEKSVATVTRMGRPPLPDEERREKPLRIRMSDSERDLVKRAAQELEQSESQWARKILAMAAKRQVDRSK